MTNIWLCVTSLDSDFIYNISTTYQRQPNRFWWLSDKLFNILRVFQQSVSDRWFSIIKSAHQVYANWRFAWRSHTSNDYVKHLILISMQQSELCWIEFAQSVHIEDWYFGIERHNWVKEVRTHLTVCGSVISTSVFMHKNLIILLGKVILYCFYDASGSL